MDQPLVKKTKAACYNYKALSSSEHADSSTDLDTATVETPMRGKWRLKSEKNVSPKPFGPSVDASEVGAIVEQYEYCIVLPSEYQELTDSGTEIVQRLKDYGFEFVIYQGLSNEIYVLLRLPLHRLREIVEADETNLLLDGDVAKRELRQGDAARGIKPCYIAHRPDITAMKPFDFIYVPYRRKLEHLYAKSKSLKLTNVTTGTSTKTAKTAAVTTITADHPFSELIRLKTIAMLLYARQADGANGMNMRALLADGTVLACYPLHNATMITTLKEKLSHYPRAYLPLDELKEYLGEKLGLYFAFAGHIASWLVIPALLGLPLQLFVFLQANLSETCLAVFAFVVALWGVMMLEFWKRKEKLLSLQWGTVNFEESEVERPDFQGELITSYIDGAQILHFPTHKRTYYFALSFLGVALLLVLALGVLVSIYLIRFTIEDRIGVVKAQILASMLNSAQIQVLNYLYGHVLRYLNNQENHRTDTQYEDSLIVKNFIFLFVNSYASFYYLAFVADFYDDCPPAGCMYSLAINLAVVFGSSLASSCCMQLVLPYLKYKYQYYFGAAEAGRKRTRPEKEYLLATYDHLSTTIEDYAELAVGFGYTALFVAALPIAALFYLIYSVLQIKGDAWKLLHLYRRPLPRGCEDIGTWQTVFLMITVASVVTNAGLAVFTMQQLDHLTTAGRYWSFLGFQWTCFALQAFTMAVIPDEPEEMSIQLRRTAFIQRKLIDKIPDADATGLAESA